MRSAAQLGRRAVRSADRRVHCQCLLLLQTKNARADNGRQHRAEAAVKHPDSFQHSVGLRDLINAKNVQIAQELPIFHASLSTRLNFCRYAERILHRGKKVGHLVVSDLRDDQPNATVKLRAHPPGLSMSFPDNQIGRLALLHALPPSLCTEAGGFIFTNRTGPSGRYQTLQSG